MIHADTVTIRPLGDVHMERVVQLHCEAFPSFFLTFLGPGFLREFYSAFLRDAHALAFVAEDSSGGVLGFVVGTQTPAGFFKRLLVSRWWAFALVSGMAVLRRPGTIGRLIRAVGYRGDAPDRQHRALLSSLAVAPQAQGTGVGRKLANHWLGETRKRGCVGAFLTTDADGNEAVNGFYRRLGWQLETSYVTPEGRRMNRYVFDFPTAPSR